MIIYEKRTKENWHETCELVKFDSFSMLSFRYDHSGKQMDFFINIYKELESICAEGISSRMVTNYSFDEFSSFATDDSKILYIGTTTDYDREDSDGEILYTTEFWDKSRSERKEIRMPRDEWFDIRDYRHLK